MKEENQDGSLTLPEPAAQKRSGVWFISDTHFGHGKVIQYSLRPFGSVEEMDEAMVANWNAVVRKGDRVYHLGDFAFSSVMESAHTLRQLNGDIHLIRGNHDAKRPAHWDDLFASVSDTKMLKVEGQKIFLCHYAFRTWPDAHRGAWNLHGHSHGTLPRLPGFKQLDMGVDCWGYRPVAFEELKPIMDAITFSPVDHHGSEPEGLGGGEAVAVPSNPTVTTKLPPVQQGGDNAR